LLAVAALSRMGALCVIETRALLVADRIIAFAAIRGIPCPPLDNLKHIIYDN
jgi:hypothetical protein